jgi:hypothetical protein
MDFYTSHESKPPSGDHRIVTGRDLSLASESSLSQQSYWSPDRVESITAKASIGSPGLRSNLRPAPRSGSERARSSRLSWECLTTRGKSRAASGTSAWPVRTAKVLYDDGHTPNGFFLTFVITLIPSSQHRESLLYQGQ